MIACLKGREGVVKLVLGAGVDPDAARDSGWTALIDAFYDGQISMAKTLLEVSSEW